MPSVNTSGTQAATVGTEHTLATVTTAGTYVLVVDANPLASGDTLELRIYDKVLGTSTSRVAYKGTFQDAQDADDKVKLSIPVPATHEYKATLKQTAGTGRSFDWEIRAL